jgi:hypothetical protein
VLCGVLFLVLVPVHADLLIIIIMPYKTWQLDYAFNPKARALDFQILVLFCHGGLIIGIK